MDIVIGLSHDDSWEELEALVTISVTSFNDNKGVEEIIQIGYNVTFRHSLIVPKLRRFWKFNAVKKFGNCTKEHWFTWIGTLICFHVSSWSYWFPIIIYDTAKSTDLPKFSNQLTIGPYILLAVLSFDNQFILMIGS